MDRVEISRVSSQNELVLTADRVEISRVLSQNEFVLAYQNRVRLELLSSSRVEFDCQIDPHLVSSLLGNEK